MDDVSSFSHRQLSTILKDPQHPHHAAAKAERDRRNLQKEAFGRANFTQQLKKKGIDVDKMHADNVKDATAAKKRAAAASKDLTDFRKKTGMTSESKDDFEPHMMYDPKTGKGYKANKPEDHERMAKMGYSHDKPKVNEVSSNTLSNYMRKSAADAGKPRQDARTQDKRIGGQKMADDKLRKMDGKGSAAKVAATNEVLDTPKAMQSYKDKAKYSKDKATNSAVANILRKGDHTDDLKTRAKRVKGLGMADRNATNKTAKALRKEESVNELSKDTMQSYWNKTKGDDAFSGSRKANNRLKGAINVTTKLDRLKKMVKK